MSPPPRPFCPSYSIFECWQITEQLRSQTLSFVQHWVGNGRGRGGGEEGQKEVNSGSLPNTFDYQ